MNGKGGLEMKLVILMVKCLLSVVFLKFVMKVIFGIVCLNE